MKHTVRWKQTLITGACITLISEFYWNLFYDSFRISLSVVILPILLMTLDLEINPIVIGLSSGGILFLFRSLLALAEKDTLMQAVRYALPGGMYYIFYCLFFYFMVRNRHTVKFPHLMTTILFCDFFANLLETNLVEDFLSNNFSVHRAHLSELLAIAVVRTVLVGFILLLIDRYRSLLTQKEHEQRYQRLFLMTAGLKNEIYFMRKNTEEIEGIMGNAYRLYESLSNQNADPKIREWALAIARDVHEIKKDYIGIIQGLEQEVNSQYPEKEMRFSDILIILRDLTYRQIEVKHLKIVLDFRCKDDFLTQGHYSMMLILKNLVNNAMEAIEFHGGKGRIGIFEQKVGETYSIHVVDNGPGIPEKNISKIFQPGFSTKFDLKTGNIYRGVGLSGVQSVVKEQFHGTIRVSSQPNVGTEFCVDIPVTALERRTE